VKRSKDTQPETRNDFLERFGKAAPENDWPEALDYLWDLFWALCAERQDGPNGPQPLTSEQIRAWSQLRRVSLTPEEAELLSGMDQAFLLAHAEEVAAAWRPKLKGER